MEDVDVQSLTENLKRNRLKNTLLQRKSLLSLSLTGISIPLLNMSDIELLEYSTILVAGFELKTIIDCYKKQLKLDEEKIKEVLRSSEYYRLCIEEYDKYLEAIATLVKSLGLTNSKEIVAYLGYFIKSGQVSKNMQLKNHKYKYENNYLEELSGARVTTGETTTLHTNEFLRDILRKLGYDTALIKAASVPDDPINRCKENRYTYNTHLTVVSENGLSFLYDPTKALFVSSTKRISSKSKYSEQIREYIGQRRHKYLIINNIPQGKNIDGEQEIALNGTTELLLEHEMLQIKKDVEDAIQRKFFLSNRFFIDHNAERSNIETLYKNLNPVSDEPIKKWIIK